MPSDSAPSIEWLDLEKTHARLTFDTIDRAEQDDQFQTWCGWFGLDELDTPYEVNGNKWLIRKGGNG